MVISNTRQNIRSEGSTRHATDDEMPSSENESFEMEYGGEIF